MIGRFFQAVVVLIIVALVTFTVIQLAPGGPEILMDPDLSEEDRVLIIKSLGIDRPIWEQFARWVWSLLQGDLGTSFTDGRPVIKLVFERLPATLLLSAVGLFISILIAIPLGVLSSLRPYTWMDNLATFFSFFGISIPGFWFGIILIMIFSIKAGLLPSAGMYTPGVPQTWADLMAHMAMPAFVLATAYMAQLMRYTRASMFNAMRQDYVRTARSKGLLESIVTYKHALRNAMIPVVTVIGLLLPRLVGGTVITETIFAWPGMGRLAVDAAFKRDFPVVMGVTILFSVSVVLANLLIDLIYPLLDPRIRLTDDSSHR